MEEKLGEEIILENEIDKARRKIKTDAYSMSIGEIITKINNDEIILSPKFQRYFRWTNKQQSDLIESIFLNIPIPPIFVFTRNDGKWDIVDGLQRLNTIDKFSTNKITLYEKESEAAYIKDLKLKKYSNLSEKLKLMFKSKRIDVILILNESSVESKYDIFNRLNTGGTSLSEQEITNCVMIMTNENFYDYLEELYKNSIFKSLVINQLSKKRQVERIDLDLILRFLSFRNICNDIKKIDAIKSVNKFLDNNAIEMCKNKEYEFEKNRKAFIKTFELLKKIFGNDAFKKYDIKKEKFVNKFNFPRYEFLVSGIGYYIDYWNEKNIQNVEKNLLNDYKEFCKDNSDFQRYTESGISAETRLKKLIPLSKKFFAKYE